MDKSRINSLLSNLKVHDRSDLVIFGVVRGTALVIHRQTNWVELLAHGVEAPPCLTMVILIVVKYCTYPGVGEGGQAECISSKLGRITWNTATALYD